MSELSADFPIAAVSLGSNIRPEDNLKACVRELAEYGTIRSISRVWESAPVGFLDQPNFLNAAVLLEIELSPEDIKPNIIAPIETKLERIRDPENINAPRTIDLDLSLFITPSESRVLDPEILKRAFVAVPLAELLPDFVHPDAGLTLAEIADSLPGSRELIPRPDCDLTAEIWPRL